MLMNYCVVVKAKWLPACHGQRQPACHFGLLNACFKLMLVLRFGLGWSSCPLPTLQRFQTSLWQWGRRLLAWPAGSPGVAVQGQLGWHDADTTRLCRAASLCARLMSLPPDCYAGHIVRYASCQPQSWVHSILVEVCNAGVPHPHDSGIHMGCTQSLLQGWLRHLKVVLSNRADALYAAALRDCGSLQDFACWQPRPQLHSVVYGPHVAARCARYWGLARCGHHSSLDGRAARHRTRNAAAIASATPFRFCTCGTDSLSHALLQCPAHSVARQRWRSSSQHADAFNLHTLFSTDRNINTARDLVNNINFVASVCIAAEACER